MKLTKQMLFEMIEKMLLTELFDAAPYDFELTTKGEVDDYAEAIYKFTAQKTPKSDEYIYTVEIRGFTEGIPMWDIDFHTNSLYAYGLTGEKDPKIYPTIVAIVEHFVSEVRPEYSDKFSKIEKFSASAQREFQGDNRRARIYAGLLKRMGAINVETVMNHIEWKIPVKES